MSTALEHPLVAGYLHDLDIALSSLPPGAAAELSEQLRAHLLEALLPGADDDTVTEVLAALGPAVQVALAAAEPGPDGAGQPALRRAVARARRVPGKIWISLAVLAIAVGVPAGALIYWNTQPEITVDGSYSWWSAEDAAHSVQTSAGDETQDTVPLRPGHIQGFAIFVYNPIGAEPARTRGYGRLHQPGCASAAADRRFDCGLRAAGRGAARGCVPGRRHDPAALLPVAAGPVAVLPVLPRRTRWRPGHERSVAASQGRPDCPHRGHLAACLPRRLAGR